MKIAGYLLRGLEFLKLNRVNADIAQADPAPAGAPKGTLLLDAIETEEQLDHALTAVIAAFVSASADDKHETLMTVLRALGDLKLHMIEVLIDNSNEELRR